MNRKVIRMFDQNKIQELRLDTSGIDFGIHLNNAGASLMPTPVVEAMRQFLDLETKIGGYEAAAAKYAEIANFYRTVARMIYAKPHQIAFASSATDAYSRALSSIPFEKGDVILTTTDDYVSNQLAFIQLEKRFGVQLVRAENRIDGTVDLNSIDALLHKFQPKVLAVTHMPTNSGLIQPIEEIGAICANFTTYYIVDACQTAGQLCLDVNRIKCDFLSATFRKFLRGARGTGFLFVSDRILRQGLTPLFVDLQGATWSSKNDFSIADDAKRFELWERSYIGLLGSWIATQYYLEVGPNKIESRIKDLANDLRTKLGQISSIQILDRGADLGGIVTFNCENYNPNDLKSQLDRRNINASFISPGSALIDMQQKNATWGCRFSPHYYNTKQELYEVVDAVAEIVREAF